MGFFVLFKRDLKNCMLNPVLLINDTIYPLMLILIFGYLNSGSYGKSVTSYDYFGISMLVYIGIMVSCKAANNFMEKRVKYANMRVVYSPISISYIYISKILVTFLFNTICMFALIGISELLLNINFGGKNALYVFIILTMLNLFSSTVGILCCCIFKSEENTNTILSTINNIIAFLGGIFFKVDGLGKAIENLSVISPAKWVLKGTMQIIYDNNTSLFIPIVAALGVISILLMFLCKFAFKVEDYV